MAMECPNGHGRQNVHVNLTLDGSNPLRATDIIAQKLACGCVVGGEQYTQFQATIMKINSDKVMALQEIEENTSQRKAAAYQAFREKKET